MTVHDPWMYREACRATYKRWWERHIYRSVYLPWWVGRHTRVGTPPTLGSWKAIFPLFMPEWTIIPSFHARMDHYSLLSWSKRAIFPSFLWSKRAIFPPLHARMDHFSSFIHARMDHSSSFLPVSDCFCSLFSLFRTVSAPSPPPRTAFFHTPRTASFHTPGITFPPRVVLGWYVASQVVLRRVIASQGGPKAGL